NPYDVKVDAGGNLLIADRYWSNIRKVTPTGTISTLYHTPARVKSLALDGAGNIFFTCENFTAYKIDPTGTLLDTVTGWPLTAGSSGDGGLATAARFSDMGQIAIGPTGNIYIVDETNNKVREITYPVIPVLPITGTTVLCQGASDTLHDATPGGTWTSNNTAIATIDLNTGVLNGVAAGNAIITYRTSFNFATTLITITSPGSVGSAGKVLGLNYACPGKTVILTETMPGGEWTSSNTAVSTINNAGLVRAIRPGSAVLTYTIVGACGAEVSLKFPFKTLTYEECIGTEGIATTPSAGMETAIQAWPNPNEGTFSINMESGIDEQVKVTITNVVGQKIKELTTVTNKHLDVKLDGVGGLYFINAVSEHGQWSQKVLVNASH
ncbi:MAG: surface protein, partial [Flavipsychrobacter sp.]|nr:surface protein [Flavipsychrobacter sp.]